MMDGLETNPSPKKIEWLKTLAREGRAQCPYRGTVSRSCLQANWTSWAWLRDGECLSTAEIEERYDQPDAWGAAINDGWKLSEEQILTQRGRAVLSELTPERND